MRHHKALVDIISIVKRAAIEQSPLLTADERAVKAVAKVSEGREFTPEQQQWLDRIRRSLAENLSIDREDFDIMPSLEGAGGWGKANSVFEGKLIDLLNDLNQAVAA